MQCNQTTNINLIFIYMYLLHKTSQVKFEFLGFFKPQFSSAEFVRLKNLKTGNVESFLKTTYLQYFTILN